MSGIAGWRRMGAPLAVLMALLAHSLSKFVGNLNIQDPGMYHWWNRAAVTTPYQAEGSYLLVLRALLLPSRAST